MASLRELRRKVKSVRSTQQITKAMKMVAAARLRKAQIRILGARPFADKMRQTLADILWEVLDPHNLDAGKTNDFQHPLLTGTPGGPRGLVLVTADRGLCGSFNTNVIKRGLEFLRENQGRPLTLFFVGRKGRDFFRKFEVQERHEYVGIFGSLRYAQAEMISQDVIEFFNNQHAEDVTMIYTEFKSAIQQNVVTVPLLPLRPPPRPVGHSGVSSFIYEPDRTRLLSALFLRDLKSDVYRALLESYASEVGARMTAMENASSNARELIERLTLTANKIRQAAITKEISELVGGAEALQ